jgi:hypothetical protein
MRVIDILETLGDEAKGLPEDGMRETVVRVRFVRRHGRVVADVVLSDGRRRCRARGQGVNPREAIRDAVA